MNGKILKTCNCCGRDDARLMGRRAQKAYCRTCKGVTYWSPASAEIVAALNARYEQNIAIAARLMGGDS